MPFWPQFVTVGERFVENTSSCRIKLIMLLFYQNILNPEQAPLGQLLQMAAHASDWGNSLNPCRMGGNELTMVKIFVGCLVLGDDPNITLFLPYKPTDREFLFSLELKSG